jgi:hypothetical protein
MFGEKSRRIKELEAQLKEANERCERLLKSKLCDPATAEDRIALARKKKECEKLDVCYVCGKTLKAICDNPYDENTPRFRHECPDHGVMFMEYW